MYVNMYVCVYVCMYVCIEEHQRRLDLEQSGQVADLTRRRLELEFNNEKKKMQSTLELTIHQLNNSQNASISKSTDRDVKLLQHEMRNLHSLKHDVLDLKDRHQNEIKNEVHQLKSEVYALSEAHKRSNVKSDVADIQVKMQDLRRDVMMHDVRFDKTQMHILDLQKKQMA